jgi:hypothetical protein
MWHGDVVNTLASTLEYPGSDPHPNLDALHLSFSSHLKDFINSLKQKAVFIFIYSPKYYFFVSGFE